MEAGRIASPGFKFNTARELNNAVQPKRHFAVQMFEFGKHHDPQNHILAFVIGVDRRFRESPPKDGTGAG